MTILLNARLWIALALALALVLSHFTAYRAGKNVVRAQWDNDKAERVSQALMAEQAARQREQELVAALHNTEKKYVEQRQKASVAAAGARTELERLRSELAAPRGPAPADPATPIRADDRTGLESELLGHCATALVGLAQEADRLEAVVVGLQQYVRQVCVRP
jgi:hypothetical protein